MIVIGITWVAWRISAKAAAWFGGIPRTDKPNTATPSKVPMPAGPEGMAPARLVTAMTNNQLRMDNSSPNACPTII